MFQRARILSSLAELCYEQRLHSLSIASIVVRAGVSRTTFYTLFENRDACFHAAFDDAVAYARSIVAPAYDAERDWIESIRAGLQALLDFLDQEPTLAWLCVVESLAAAPETLERRQEVLRDLRAVVDRGRYVGGARPQALAAEAIVGGAFAVIHARLIEPDGDSLTALLNPLMSAIVLPYLGKSQARRELLRRDSARHGDPPDGFPHATRGADHDVRVTYRTARTLATIAEMPEANNRQISQAAGITDQGQMSRLVARLARLGLIENVAEGQPKHAPNAWTLTEKGRQLDQVLRARFRLPAHERLSWEAITHQRKSAIDHGGRAGDIASSGI